MIFKGFKTKKIVNKKSLLYLLSLIYKEKKHIFLAVVPLIFFIGIGHSLYVFSIGPLLKSFFSINTKETVISLASFFHIQKDSFLFPLLTNISLSKESLVLFLPLLLFLSAIIKNVSTYLYQILVSKLSYYFTRIYRECLFGSIVLKEYRELVAKTPARWMSIVMNDVFFLQDRMILLLNHSVRDLIVLVVAIVVLFFVYGKVALLVCVSLGLGYFLLSTLSKKILTLATEYQENLSFITNSILEVRRRYHTIKTSSSEKIEILNFKSVTYKYYLLVLKSCFLRLTIPPFVECFGFFALAFFVYQLNTENSGGSLTNLNILITFTVLATTIRPLKNIGEQIGLIHEIKGATKESLKHISSFSLNTIVKKKSDNLSLRSKFTLSLSFQRICCGIKDKILLSCENINFTCGKSYFICGPSGCGKSTFLKTLVGLIPPHKWLANYRQEDLVFHSHYVAQRPYTFDDTIKDIVLYGIKNKNKISENNIWSALLGSDIADLIQSLPEKLETRVSSLKDNFSGGQIQRLLLSRLFLAEEKILVLDEPSSHIDVKSERVFFENLLVEIRKKNKILIVVHHDLSLSNLFNQVFYISNQKMYEKK